MTERKPFSLYDFEQECEVNEGVHPLDKGEGVAPIGLEITVPSALHERYPFNASAYALMQQLRNAIYEYGLIEFPGLPVNKTNYTLAQIR